jgi:F1F0 ATPase subunit 2
MTADFDLNIFSGVAWSLLFWMLIGGFALGLFFFGSLWFATRKLLHSKRPVLWMLGGFVVRIVVVLPSLYWLSGAHWQRLIICIVGFILARILVIRLTAKFSSSHGYMVKNQIAKKTNHAP